MQFVYKPEGVEPRKWSFKPYKLLSPEAEAIERLTGLRFAQWANVVTEGSMIALRALLFVLLKRDEPTLKFNEVQFSLSEVDFELDDEETAKVIETLEGTQRDDGLDADGLALLERLRAEQPAAVDDADGDEAPTSGPGLPPPASGEESDPKAD